MKELIKHIAQSLVDNPGKVEVTEVIGEQSSVKELTVEQVSLREE